MANMTNATMVTAAQEKKVVMENYYWGSVDHKRVVIPSEEERYALGGNVYGRDGFKDGTSIMTSRIVSTEGKIAKTASGSEYELGNMHPDYAELLEAKKAGIPILNSWSLSGNLRDGYILTGQMGEETVMGLVTEQEGNYVVIAGVKDYVIWRSLDIDPVSEMFMRFSGQYCDLRIGRDFEEYMHDRGARPILFPNSAK